jgi:hypothetical protein
MLAVGGMVSCSNGSDRPPVENDLSRLENDWMHAMMQRDRARLDQLVAPQFTLSGMKYIDSAVVSRGMWIQNTMQDLKVDSIHFLKMKATTIKEVGIVRARFYWSGTYDDDHFADSASLVDTWIRNESGWQVVSRIMMDEK